MSNGQPLRLAIVRPCSGVFGGDDRLSFERAMDLTVFPGLGAKSVMDWCAPLSLCAPHAVRVRS